MNKTLTYSTAMSELAAIAEAMEQETISVDELSEKVKRAQELIAFCQHKLKQTDEDVRKALSKEHVKGK